MLLYLCFQSSHITLFSCSLNRQTSHHVQWFSRISKSKSISRGWQASDPSGFCVGKGFSLQNGSPVRFARLRSLAVDWKGNNYLKVSVKVDLFSLHLLFCHFRQRDGTLENYERLSILGSSMGFIIWVYNSYLNESALNGCSLDQQLHPYQTLASETLGNGCRIPALLFSWNVLPLVARWSNTSEQLRCSSMEEFEESIIQKFNGYIIQDNDQNRKMFTPYACQRYCNPRQSLGSIVYFLEFRYWISDILSIEFPLVELRIPKPSIPVSTSKNMPDSGIPGYPTWLHGAKTFLAPFHA